MRRFLSRHKDRIVASIAGFDRLIFKGIINPINFAAGMDKFLGSRRIPLKEYKTFAMTISDGVKKQALALAEKHNRPYIYLTSSRQSKEDLARQIMLADGIQQGLVCVLSAMEPSRSITVRSCRQTRWLRAVVEQRRSLFIYFYFVDREFGLMHVRLQTWLPLEIQVWMNGREYLARQLDRRGIRYQRHDNCVTHISDIQTAQKILRRLQQRHWVPFLTMLATRVNPWLTAGGQYRLPSYYWMVEESEYAMDLQFKSADSLREIYHDLLRYALEHFGPPDVLRFLSRHAVRGDARVQTDLKSRPEGIRIKHWVQGNSIKMYDKALLVLRIEVTINSPNQLYIHRAAIRKGKKTIALCPLRKGVFDIGARTQLSSAAVKRYLQALSVVGMQQPSRRVLDPVCKSVQCGNKRFRSLHPISPTDAELFETVMPAKFRLDGFKNKDLRKHIYGDTDDPVTERRNSSCTTRKLQLLRAHGLIERVTDRNLYRVTEKGEQVMGIALQIRKTKICSLAA